MRRTYYNSLSFTDLLFQCLLVLAICLIILSMLSAIQKNKADIETKAEFVAIVTWTPDYNNDVDIWIEDPAENILWYHQREIGVMHLDRDDRGSVDDIYETRNNEIIAIEINQEIATIRGIIPGEWIINIHMYRMSIPEPTDVTVKIIKLHPTANTVLEKKYVMTRYWEEITVCRMMINSDGKVFDIDDTPKNLVKSKTSTFQP